MQKQLNRTESMQAENNIVEENPNEALRQKWVRRYGGQATGSPVSYPWKVTSCCGPNNFLQARGTEIQMCRRIDLAHQTELVHGPGSSLYTCETGTWSLCYAMSPVVYISRCHCLSLSLDHGVVRILYLTPAVAEPCSLVTSRADPLRGERGRPGGLVSREVPGIWKNRCSPGRKSFAPSPSPFRQQPEDLSAAADDGDVDV
jgi:hypothetical protein